MSTKLIAQRSKVNQMTCFNKKLPSVPMINGHQCKAITFQLSSEHFFFIISLMITDWSDHRQRKPFSLFRFLSDLLKFVLFLRLVIFFINYLRVVLVWILVLIFHYTIIPCNCIAQLFSLPIRLLFTFYSVVLSCSVGSAFFQLQKKRLSLLVCL